MRFNGIVRIFLAAALSALVFCGCVQKKEVDDGAKAPGGTSTSSGGGSKSKIVFKYDPRAPRELLKVQKGPGEAAHVAVYVGDTRVGTLNFGTVVQKIGEEKGWYKIRYYNNDAEFFGYIKYSEAVPTDRPKQITVIPVGEDAKPKMLSIQDTDQQLSEIIKVPFQLKMLEGDSDRKPKKLFGTGKNIDGYDDFSTLEDYKDDAQAHIYAKKMYQELSDLFKSCPPNFQPVLNAYGEALTAFSDKNMRMFRNKAEDAKRKRDYIMGSY